MISSNEYSAEMQAGLFIFIIPLMFPASILPEIYLRIGKIALVTDPSQL